MRNPYFDLVKAIAISMVIWGHVRGFAAIDMFPTWTDNFRVGMNMPIFFMLSGYFAWPTIEACDWRKAGRTVRGWFQPALFAGIAYTLIGMISSPPPPPFHSIIGSLIRSVFIDPWFITTLAECYLLLFVSFVVGKRTGRSLLIVVACLAVAMCLPLFMLGRIHWGCLTSMMPHFCFGAIVLRKYGHRLWENRMVGIICFVAFMSFVLLEGNVENNGMSFYTADSSISAFQSVRGSVCFVVRPVVGLMGAVGVMTLIKIALDTVPSLVGLAKIGTLTLGIYIFHLWPLRQLRSIAWIGSSWWSVTLTSIAMLSFFSIVTWLLMEKTGRFRKWIWGR